MLCDLNSRCRKNFFFFQQKRKDVRLSVFLHGTSTKPEDVDNLTYNRAIQLVLNLRDKLISGIAKFILKFLQSELSLQEIVKSEENINELAAGITVSLYFVFGLATFCVRCFITNFVPLAHFSTP